MSLTDINTRIARQPAHARDAGGFPMSYLDDLKHDLADKAYREAYLEAVRADNDCNDQTMILAYRDVVAALEAQLAATEARECRTRQALEYAAKIANDAAMVIDRLDGYDFHGSSKLALILELNHVASKAKAALAASGPCPHAAEVERLTATNHEIAGTLTEIVIERNALRGELAAAQRLCGEAAPHIGRIGHGPNSPTSREYDDLAARLRAAEGRES